MAMKDDREKALTHLDHEDLKVIMFCGKGGVGKTTCAAATATHFSGKGYRVLLFSSDPTPSLSDILEVDVRGSITQIDGVEGLEAVELDYETVVEMWKEEFGDEVYEVISSFLPVGREIIEYIANAPGIDEEFALSYIYKIYKEGDYDLIVWDTAPAGGTLSLIKLQDKLYRHLGEAARLYIRVRKALDTLTKGRVKRDPLTLIAEWESLAQAVLDMLRDEKTYSIVVTIPEALGVNQTEKVVKELKSFGVRVERILVNFVLPEEALTSDFYRGRSEMQKKYIEILEKRFADGIRVSALPLLPFEVKGLEALRSVAALLF